MTDKCIFHNCLDSTAFVCLICLRYGGQRASGKLYCVLRVAYTYTPSYVARTGLHLAGWQYSPNLMLTFLYMDVNLVFLIVSDNLGSFCLFFLVGLLCCWCFRFLANLSQIENLSSIWQLRMAGSQLTEALLQSLKYSQQPLIHPSCKQRPTTLLTQTFDQLSLHNHERRQPRVKYRNMR